MIFFSISRLRFLISFSAQPGSRGLAAEGEFELDFGRRKGLLSMGRDGVRVCLCP